MKALFDFFPLLVFFVAYKLYGIFVATGATIAASAVQVGAYWVRHRRFQSMQVATLVLLVIFGGITIAFHDDTFIKWKVSVVNWLFAAVVLGSQIVGDKPAIERLLGDQLKLPRALWTRLNLSWGLFFLVLGALNYYVAFVFRPALDAAARQAIWVDFKVWGTLGLTLLFAVGQAFVIGRHVAKTEEDKA